jgi:hypothetical protein
MQYVVYVSILFHEQNKSVNIILWYQSSSNIDKSLNQNHDQTSNRCHVSMFSFVFSISYFENGGFRKPLSRYPFSLEIFVLHILALTQL